MGPPRHWEPVAASADGPRNVEQVRRRLSPKAIRIYRAPPQATWIGQALATATQAREDVASVRRIGSRANLDTKTFSENAPENERFATSNRTEIRRPYSREVNSGGCCSGSSARRISAPHGLSHGERDLLVEGFRCMREQGAGVFVSIEAGQSLDAEGAVRDLTRRMRSDLVQRQRRAGMRRGLLATVFEALGRDHQPKFNAHVIAIMPDRCCTRRLIDSLHRSSVYAGHVDARPVDNWSRLTTYLLKEATPQAWFGAGKRFRRIRGSIPLGKLGGNRVVLSLDLKAALIHAGRIEPYRRSYAKRLPKAPMVRELAHSEESGP